MKQKIETLHIEDLLSSCGPLTVQGIALECKVSVWLVRDVLQRCDHTGYTDDLRDTPTIDSIQYGAVYVVLPGLYDLLLLDQTNLQYSHTAFYESFKRAVEAEAIKQANKAPLSEWREGTSDL